MGTQSKVNRARRQMQQESPETVVLAYLHPGQVSGYFTESLMVSLMVDMNSRPRRVANVIQEWSSANVSAARNSLVRRFLEGAGDWLLFVDSDMQWGPTAVHDLLDSADAKAAPIVGGLCFGMSHDAPFPTIYHFAKTDDGLTTVRVRDYPRDTMVRCAATGAAFLLIHRDVLVDMWERGFNETFPWFQETELGGKPAGEDLTFCIRAGILGVPVHVNTAVKVGHHKSHVITERVADDSLATSVPGDVGLVIPTRGDHPDMLRAIIATSGLPPERVVVVANGIATLDLGGLPATVLADTGPVNIHRWWNAGIDLLADRGCTRVAVLNDDVIIDRSTLPRLSRGLGSATLAVLDGDPNASGHCWLLNVAHGVRPDESYRWWCGDLQLWADAEAARGVVRVPDAWCLHLHANESTSASPDLAALAEADGALYDSRHPAGSPHERIPPKES